MSKTIRTKIMAGAAALALGAAVQPLHAAPEIGVAAAVNPQATGKLSDGAQRTIVIGEKLSFRERVQTTEGGLVQVLLLDGSTFTVGPNSDLVIDEFVYDPATKNGKLVATFSKGVMRFIGGKLSKNEGGVQVRTPVGLMGIRGGVADVQVTNSNSAFFSMIFGEELSLLGPDGKLRQVLQAGYGIDVTQGLSGPIEVRQVTDSEAKLFISQLSGKVGTSGGATQTPTTQNIQKSGVSSQGSNSDPDATGPGARADAVQSEEAANLHQNTLAKNTIIARKDMRVLSIGSQYSVANPDPESEVPFETIDPAVKGIVGATTGEDPAGADQQVNFAINALLLGSATLQQGGITIPYPILEGTYIIAGVPSPFGTLTGTAMFGPNLDFTFYRLFANGDTNKPVYLIGGNATPEDKLIGTGDVLRYKVGQDIVQQIDIPFVTAATAGSDTASAFVSDLFLVRPDGERFDDDTNADTKGTPVALQASLQIDGSGDTQISTLLLGVGNIADETLRLGGTRQASGEWTTAFSGNFDVIKGPDGAQMFGPDGKYMVLGPAIDDGKVFIDTPDTADELNLDDLVSATIHVAILDSQTQLDTLTRNLDTLTGYAAGMVESVGSENAPLPFRSEFSDDLKIVFNPGNNTLGGELIVRNPSDMEPPFAQSLQVAFGDGIVTGEGEGAVLNEENGPSAMVDDDVFAAGPNPNTERTVLTELTEVEGEGGPFLDEVAHTASTPATGTYIVSSKLVGDKLPDGKAPCTCEFMKWGYWGTKPNFNTAESATDTNVHVGTWVAGDVAKEVDLPLQGTASYEGHAVGSVMRSNEVDGTRQYLAAGNLDINWDFGARSGDMKISNFDGLGDITGTMESPVEFASGDPAGFGGNIGDGAGITGSANGAFVSGVEGSAPLGVMGAFDLNGTAGPDTYSAAGTFAGETFDYNPAGGVGPGGGPE